MTYRRLGSGRPLIVAPGLAGTYRSYALLLNCLAERFETILYTYPGDEPGDGARLGSLGHEAYVEDLWGLMDHLDLREPYVLGVSFGSTVVLSALARSGDRVPRGVLQGGFAYRRYTLAERLALRVGALFPGRVQSLPFRERVLAWNSQSTFPRVLAARWRYYLDDNARTPLAALAHRCRLLTRLDLRDRLHAVSVPLLLLHGNEDRIVPRGLHEELAAGLPRAQSKVMPLVGHQPHYTHAELTARLVTDFLLDITET